MSYKRPPIPESAKRINREYDSLIKKENKRHEEELDKITRFRVLTLRENSKRIK